MAELIPNIARAYWRVLCAIAWFVGIVVVCGFFLLVWLLICAVLEKLTGTDPDQDDRWRYDDDAYSHLWKTGLWWTAYGAIAAVIGVWLDHIAAAPWWLAPAVAAVGVLPIYWGWPWSRPYEDRLIRRTAAAQPTGKQQIVWPWRTASKRPGSPTQSNPPR